MHGKDRKNGYSSHGTAVHNGMEHGILSYAVAVFLMRSPYLNDGTKRVSSPEGVVHFPVRFRKGDHVVRHRENVSIPVVSGIGLSFFIHVKF